MKLDTLTLRYWQNFDLADEELQYVSELLIEEESPLTAEALALRLMEKRVRQEEAVWEDRRAKGSFISLVTHMRRATVWFSRL